MEGAATTENQIDNNQSQNVVRISPDFCHYIEAGSRGVKYGLGKGDSENTSYGNFRRSN